MRRNDEVATLLEEFADRLEATGVEYKPSAYRRAAENVREHATPVESLAADGEDAVAAIDRVGEAIAAKIVEYVDTGSIAELEALREELPADIEALTAIEGVGPKTVGTLYEALGITTLDEMEAAAEAGEIREVSGFGAKTETAILEHIPFARQSQARTRLGDARPLADDALAYLRDVDAVSRVEVCGSIRRWRDTIGDVDLLVASADRDPVFEAFLTWPAVDETIEAGTSKASVRATGTRIDLRVVDDDQFGAALQYFTGSLAHNVALRNRALDQGLTLNEYGLFELAESPEETGENPSDAAEGGDVDTDTANGATGDRVAGETETGVYEALGLSFVPPELREDTGEIAAAAAGDLPALVETDALCGDLHTHTDWSDGGFSIETMVTAAEARGYDYYAVTDHGEGPGVFGDIALDGAALTAQAETIADVAEDASIEVLHGVEANIAADGSIAPDEDVLADLDVVVASPHAGLDADPAAATDRLVSAVEHPAVDILGHPTGRLINSRPGLTPNMETVAEAAAREGVAIEVNANPARLDADGTAVRAAIDAGATIVVNTDAHAPEDLDNARYGVHTARRGWAESADVLNTYSLSALRSFLS